MMKILELLRSRSEQRRAASLDEVWRSARRVANGQTVDAASVEIALLDTGLTLVQFEELAALAGKRKAWHAAAAKMDAVAAKLAKLEGTEQRERGVAEAAYSKWQQRQRELLAEISEANAEHAAGITARMALRDPANVPGSLGERLRAAIDAHDAHRVAVGDIHRELRGWKDKQRVREQLAEQTADPRPAEAAEHRRLAKQAARQVADLETQMQQAVAAEADSVAVLEAVQQEAESE